MYGAISLAVLIIAVIGIGFYGGNTETSEMEEVTVMMPYLPSVGWAPFYCAIDQGYYADEGLEVIMEYSPTGSVAPIQQVGADKIEFGYADVNTLIMSRAKGIPIVAVYQGEQTNVFNLIVKKDSGITKPQDLDGKEIAVVAIGAPPHLMASAILFNSDVDLNNINFVPVGSGGEIPALLQEKVDAIGAHMVHTFILNGMDELENVNVMWSFDYGVNSPANAIVVNEKTLRDNPKRIRKFVQATNRGLKYAVDHPEEATDIYIKFNPDAAEKRSFHFEYWKAYLSKSIQPDKYPLGQFNKDQWTVTQDTLFDLGIITKKTPISEMYTDEFVPK